MAADLRVPPLGESIVEATVGQWLKSEGEAVTAGEPVVELETEKITLQVSADASGVLERIDKPAGATVRPGDVLGTIAAAAPKRAQAGAGPGAAATSPAAPAPTRSPERSAPTAPAAPPPNPPPPGAPTEATAAEGAPAASSVARQIAAERGIDLRQVEGTGPGGRVTRVDVENYLAEHAPTAGPVQPPAMPLHSEEVERSYGRPSLLESAPLPTETAPPAAAERPVERIRLSRRRLTIARRLLEAQQTTASLTTFNEIDLLAVMDLRSRRKERFQEQHGVSLGFMSFFVKASVAALKAYPDVNSELQGDELLELKYYDIGIAVDAPGGLVVPVIRNADRKTFADIEAEIADLAKRARENQLALDELRGGTFTITNGGIFGSLFSTPILNPPQAGILGMHRIVERPIALDGQVVIRPMMYVALTYDHRIIDGRTAVQFLVRIKSLIEDPEALFLES
jgi:2-oxoglutarate dehydrogenase E2 component (dihydrolipoamide succinyltransferase)